MMVLPLLLLLLLLAVANAAAAAAASGENSFSRLDELACTKQMTFSFPPLPSLPPREM